MWYVYVLKSKKDEMWYTGCTKDLKKRIEDHNKGKVHATNYRRPLQLIYYEASHNKYDAFRREIYLKTGMGKRFIKNRLKSYLYEKE